MTSLRVLLTMLIDQVNLQSASMSRTNSLTVNMLWKVAYGVCKEVLCLNSLEEFNATEADLMELKNYILTMWEVQGQAQDLIPQAHIHPFVCGC